MKISCVIHTHNSELHLADVLRSVGWCDEIVVVDMESTDLSLAIANEFGCKVVTHKNIGFADPARNFGLQQTTHPWVLAIDSDEIVPRELAQRLLQIVVKDEADVVELCFRNFFFGRELKGTGWAHHNLRVYRFFKRDHLRYGDKVHAFIEVSEKARRLSLLDYEVAVIHFNYLDVSHFIQKLDRYTTFEANKDIPRHPTLWGLYQILRELGGRFIILGGWKDGWVGFYLSFAMAFYRITALTKQITLSRQGIVEKYREVAAKVPMLAPAKADSDAP